MATTCLTMAAGVTVQASTLVESTDFANAPTGDLLPPGTDRVEGEIGGCIIVNEACSSFDFGDWFQFQGLQAGTPFTLTFADNASFLRAFMGVFDTSGNFIGEAAVFESGSSQVNGIVPADGSLVAAVGPIEEGGGAYVVSLDAASVPEPGTFIPVGLGLVGALAWRKQRRQQQSQKPN